MLGEEGRAQEPPQTPFHSPTPQTNPLSEELPWSYISSETSIHWKSFSCPTQKAFVLHPYSRNEYGHFKSQPWASVII